MYATYGMKGPMSLVWNPDSNVSGLWDRHTCTDGTIYSLTVQGACPPRRCSSAHRNCRKPAGLRDELEPPGIGVIMSDFFLCAAQCFSSRVGQKARGMLTL